MAPKSVVENPVREIRFTPSSSDALLLTVTIELAEHVAQCCVNPEAAFVELISKDQRLKAHFQLRDHRPGYLMEASIRLPTSGAYSYRVVAKILDQALTREGIYDACAGGLKRE